MENILNRVKLLINYDSSLTLTENVDKQKNNLITEAGEQLSQKVLMTLGKVLSANKGAFNALKNEISLFKKFNSADEVVRELELIISNKASGKITKADLITLAKEFSRNKNVSIKLQGLFSNSKIFDDVVKQIYPRGINGGVNKEALEQSKKFYEGFGITGQQFENMVQAKINPKLAQGNLPSVIGKEVMAADKSVQGLTKYPVSPKAAADEIAQIVIIDAGKAGLPKSRFEKIGETLGYYTAAGFEKLKSLRSKMSLKRAILYGLAGYGTYEYLKKLFSDEDESKISILPACVVNDKRIILTTDSSGNEVGVMLRGTGVDEYEKAGGLKFYPNNRAMTVDGNKRGTYACKTTTEIATESFNRIKINEEDIGNIQITWDTKSSGGGNEPNKFTWKQSPTCDEVVNGNKTISIGMKGECVGKIQDQLRSKGFDEVGNTDNKFGKKTKSAVIRLQRNSKLTQNGVVDAATYNVLFFDTASPSVEEIKPKQPEIQSASQSSEPQLKPAPPLPTNTAPTNNQPQQSSDAETQNIDRKGRRRRGLFRRNRQ